MSRVAIPREPEKAIQARVKACAELMGFAVSDFSQPRASMQTPGIPDLYVTHRGKKLRAWVEVKTPDGALSKEQRDWHLRTISAGGRVWVVRSASEFAAFAESYGIEA